MTERTTSPSGAARAAPLYIGPHNAEAVMGLPWRRVRDTARELRLPLVRFGKTLLVPAAALSEALSARALAIAANDQANGVADGIGDGVSDGAAEAIRTRLGVRRAP